MFNNNLNVSFFPRKDRGGASKGVPVYMAATLNGARAVICSTEIRINQTDKWNKDLYRLAGSSKRVLLINKQLDVFEAALRLTLDQCQSKSVTIEKLKKIFLAARASGKSAVTFMDFANTYLTERKAKVGSSIVMATYNRYEQVVGLFREYLIFKLSVEDIPFSKMDNQMIHGFEQFLREEKHYVVPNTIMKKMRVLKTIILAAIDRNLTDNNPFTGYKISFEKVRREYLTEAELKKIMRKTISIKRLEQVRDVFVFSCFTGISYCDICKLRHSDVIEIDGTSWLILPRGKTKEIYKVPLTSVPMTIIGKYRTSVKSREGMLLPVVSNQRTNSYLKELTDICGIVKNLTFHMARHTFSTMAINNGMPITTLKTILGHADIETTKHYIEVMDTTVSRDMERLEKSLGKKRLIGSCGNKGKKK